MTFFVPSMQFFAVLGTEFKATCVAGKHCTTKSHPHPYTKLSFEARFSGLHL
jgi:hypothetical protein